MTATPPLRAPDPLGASRRRALRRLGALKAKPLGSIGDIGRSTFGTIQTVTWEGVTDWDNAANREQVITRDMGDRAEDEIRLGWDPQDLPAETRHYWHLDEDSGSTVEDAVGSADGDVQDANLGETGVLGSTGAEITGDNAIQTPDGHLPNYSGNDGFTIGTICYPTDDSGSEDSHIPLVAYSGDNAYAGIRYHEDDEWQVAWRTSEEDFTSLKTGQNAPLDEWYVIFSRWDLDSGECHVFENGSKENNESIDSGDFEFDDEDTNVGLGTEGAQERKHFKGTLEECIWIDEALSDSVIQDLSDVVEKGELESSTKSFSTSAEPDLQELDYDLNGETIELEVIGSPGSGSEETVTQTLDGASSYSLSWSDSHTDFRFNAKISTSDEEETPILRRVELSG